MKKLLKFIVLPIMLLSCALMIGACQTPKGKIEIHTAFKTTYYVGDELSITGGVLNYTKEGTTTQVAITENMVSGFSSTNAGTYTLVITYQGLSLTLQYTIAELPELVLNPLVLYKSQYIENITSSGGGYYYLKFTALNTVGITVSSFSYTSTNQPEDILDYPAQIMAREFVNEHWVLTVYDPSIEESNRFVFTITVISDTTMTATLGLWNATTVLTLNLISC